MMGSRRAVFYLGLVFVLGFVLGALGGHYADKAGWLAYLHKGGGQGPLGWLTRELDLTPEQQKQLGPILDEAGAQYFAIFEKVRPEYEQVRQQTREKIRALLSEKQRAKFEELVRHIDEREAKERQKYQNRPRPSAPQEQGK